MLSETGFMINIWVGMIWLVGATIYTFYAVIKDMIPSKKDNADADN